MKNTKHEPSNLTRKKYPCVRCWATSRLMVTSACATGRRMFICRICGASWTNGQKPGTGYKSAQWRFAKAKGEVR